MSTGPLDRLPATSDVLVDPVFGLPVWRTLAGRLVDRRARHPQLPDAAEVRA